MLQFNHNRVGEEMYRKRTKIGIMFIICFYVLAIQDVNAACDYNRQVELMTEAANIRAAYEIGEFATGEPFLSNDTWVDGYEVRFKIDIYNVTPNIYIEVKNNYTNEVKTYYYEDTEDGTISWFRYPEEFDHLVGYTITVYSNDTSCQGDVLQIMPELVTPQFNYLSVEAPCTKLNQFGQLPYYCEPYITTDINMNYNEFLEISNAELDKLETPNESPEIEVSFWQKYGIYFLIGGALIVATCVIIIIVKRFKRRTVL